MRERAVAWRKIGLVHGGAKPGLLTRSGSELLLVLSEGESPAELLVCGRTFEAEVAQAMARQFAAFLQAFLADPEIRLGALPLVPEEEAAIVAALNATTLPFPHNRTIQDEIAARAAELPERDAVVAGKARLTYAELDRGRPGNSPAASSRPESGRGPSSASATSGCRTSSSPSSRP